MKKIVSFIIFCFLIGLVLYGINIYREYKNQEKIDYLNFIQNQEKKAQAEKEKKQALELEKCLEGNYLEEMKTEEVNNALLEVDKITEKYKVSYKYLNLNNNYTKEFNTDKEYYGASLYKLLDVIYVIEKSNKGELDLNTEIKYLAKNKRGFSTGMSKIPINSNVSIKDLLSYIGLYSDNTAHTVLADYIGLAKLQELGKSLGAKNYMNSNFYGQSTIEDIYLYLAKVYELMNLDNENAEFLKEIFNNPNVNSLNFDNIKFYHKYGMYNELYHNIGISIIDNPYLILIMSELRFRDYKTIVQDISRKFYALNEEIVDSQASYCNNLVYGGSADGQ